METLVPNNSIAFSLILAGLLMLSALWCVGAAIYYTSRGRPAAAETRLVFGFIGLLSAGAFLLTALQQV